MLLTSLSPEEASAADLFVLRREHWTIENKSHYVRDVTFGEDASQVRNGPLPQIMAAFRNTVICALRRLGALRVLWPKIQLIHLLFLPIWLCNYENRKALACEGVVPTSVNLVKELMAKTKTRTGLTTTVEIIDKEYQTGRKVEQYFNKNMSIIFDDYLPKWNYRAVPNREVI